MDLCCCCLLETFDCCLMLVRNFWVLSDLGKVFKHLLQHCLNSFTSRINQGRPELAVDMIITLLAHNLLTNL